MPTTTDERIDLLTTRERQLVQLVCDGLLNKQIAAHLGISEITVWHHLTAIYAKLQVDNRLGLVTFAHSTGLVTYLGARQLENFIFITMSELVNLNGVREGNMEEEVITISQLHEACIRRVEQTEDELNAKRTEWEQAKNKEVDAHEAWERARDDQKKAASDLQAIKVAVSIAEKVGINGAK